MISVIRHLSRRETSRSNALWLCKWILQRLKMDFSPVCPILSLYVSGHFSVRAGKCRGKHQVDICYSIIADTFPFTQFSAAYGHRQSRRVIYSQWHVCMIAKRLQPIPRQTSSSSKVIDWWGDGFVKMKCPAEKAICGEVYLMDVSFVLALWGGNVVAL